MSHRVKIEIFFGMIYINIKEYYHKMLPSLERFCLHYCGYIEHKSVDNHFIQPHHIPEDATNTLSRPTVLMNQKHYYCLVGWVTTNR